MMENLSINALLPALFIKGQPGEENNLEWHRHIQEALVRKILLEWVVFQRKIIEIKQ